MCERPSGYIAYETRSFAASVGLELCTTPYHSPESNRKAESFIKTFKRDYVYMNNLSDALTVLEQLPIWFEDYNEKHPHKGLKMMSPREYIKLSRVKECPALWGQLHLSISLLYCKPCI